MEISADNGRLVLLLVSRSLCKLLCHLHHLLQHPPPLSFLPPFGIMPTTTRLGKTNEDENEGAELTEEMAE